MKTRLQRFLADCGVASRRECEAMIIAGRVRVNGQAFTRMPVLIDPERDIITVDDQEVAAQRAAPEALKEQSKVYFLLNKPKGILVTNRDPANRKTVNELMTGVPQRVFPVGRLDMDSRGALLMTNDGELANRLTHPRYGVEKTYIVEVDGKLGHPDLEKIKRGVWLGPEHPRAQATKSAPFHLKLIGRERGRTILELRLSESKNTDIRRVMARLGHPVRDLNRISIGGALTIKNLPIGEFRPLTDHEVQWLFKASSPEHHLQKRAATQAWYEAKELEKERKRLASAHNAGVPPASRAPRAPHGNAVVSRTHAEKRPLKPRPQRKGKKPFIPPSGRNAGKPLGGNYLGRRRLDDTPYEPIQTESPTVPHPLGKHAKTDD